MLDANKCCRHEHKQTKESTGSIGIFEQKIKQRIKERLACNGKLAREYPEKEDSVSPTASMEENF